MARKNRRGNEVKGRSKSASKVPQTPEEAAVLAEQRRKEKEYRELTERLLQESLAKEAKLERQKEYGERVAKRRAKQRKPVGQSGMQFVETGLRPNLGLVTQK